jgi:RNA polymerase sigma-70 factor, ECF subfamily
MLLVFVLAAMRLSLVERPFFSATNHLHRDDRPVAPMASLPGNPGDNDAAAKLFVALLARHERSLSGYILSLVPNWTDADDLLQETKLRLWEQFRVYDSSKDFGVWARTIAHYQVLTYRKRSHRQSARFTSTCVELVAAEAAAVATEADTRHRLLAECLAALSDASRKVLAFCYSDNLSIKDAAVKLGRSVRGLQRAVANLRRTLQQCVEDRLHQEERE